jgi:alkylation response protein AidB-like acyl-CoA dehydrogenase
MDFTLTPEQQDLQKAAREFAAGEFTPALALQLERERQFPHELLRQAGSLGFVGLHLPEAHGGQGCGALERALVAEAFCRQDSGIGPCFEIATFAGGILAHCGTEAQQARWLPAMCRGESLGAIGFTEPNHGSDLLALDTTARRDGDDHVLNGSKIFTSLGELADLVIVLAMTDPDARPTHRGMSMFIVETDREGFVAESVGEKMGLHMIPTATLALTEVRVPAGNLVGEPGSGFRQALGFFTHSRVAIAAMGVGLGQGAFDRAVAHVRRREQFGQRLADFQAIQHRVAQLGTDLELARLLVYKAAWSLDAGREDPVLSAMAKNAGSRVAIQTADAAVQLLGGYGYLLDNEVERIYRDARIMDLWEGTREMQLGAIGRALLR